MTRIPFAQELSWDWSTARTVCLVEARSVLGGDGRAEDAAQEATLRAWRQRASCRTPERPAPWLARIARNEALRVAGQRAAETLEGIDAPEPSHEREAVLRATVRGVLDQLPEGDRALLLARYWHDLTYAQMADRFEIPEGTVKVRLHRLHRRLRDLLTP